MDILEQLEYPLPILKVLSEKIVVETSKTEEGWLEIDNIGSGRLSGRIMSNSPALTFTKVEFSGNQNRIPYVVDTEGCKPGDVLHSDVVVMSNGGEKIVPVIIKVIPSCIITEEEFKISTLKDFLAYAKKYPFKARLLFATSEFMSWLMSIHYEYLEIFDYFVKDPNKERALENFFILSKLKNRTVLSTPEKIIEINIDPGQKDVVERVLTVKKSGWGYVDASITVEEGGEWLSVSPARIVSGGFAEEENTNVRYFIDTAKLGHKLTSGRLSIAGNISVEIRVKKRPYLSVELDRTSYDFDGSGVLKITNNSGGDLMLEISAKEGFLKLEGRRYFMSAYAEIPFQVKFTALQMAQMAIKKQPYIENEVTVAATADMRVVRRTVRVVVGKTMAGV